MSFKNRKPKGPTFLSIDYIAAIKYELQKKWLYEVRRCLYCTENNEL